MHFTRLRLAGFKSFVEPVELRIDPGLTGVVGPNGCGKSNLLEAMRWVMGEGSAKSLRGGGMEDVIFAGTATRPSRQFADVTLVLDNSTRKAPAAFNDSETIEVVRRIERGLGSAYRLNGREVRQRDVQLLFADAATGAHSPALVSQGRIGAIVAAKPVERRVLLEEAAGISGLHARRKEAEIRLRAAEANLLRLADVLKALEAQAAALKRQARQAERYRQISERLRLVEAQLLFAKWRDAAQAANNARAAAATAEAQVAATVRDAAMLAAQQADAAAGLAELREAQSVAAAAWQALVQASNAAAQALARTEARRGELTASAEVTRRDMSREDTLAQDAAAAELRLTGEITALRDAAETARSALPLQHAALAQAELQAAQAELALNDAVEAHARAAAQSRAAVSAFEAVQGRFVRTEAEAARLQRELDQTVADDQSNRLRDAAMSALAQMATAVAAAAKAVELAESERQQREQQREAGQLTWQVARGAVTALTIERDALQRRLADPERANARAVAEVIRVEPGFETALAAALGDDLSAPLASDIPNEGQSGAFWELGAVDMGADGLGAAWPAGIATLAAQVTAPRELALRLQQIGVIDAAPDATMLAGLRPGQRLVNRAGQLWRWDGYRCFGGQGAAAAERFVARNRLLLVIAELIDAEAALGLSNEARLRTESAAKASSEAERSARLARSDAERAHDQARTVAAKSGADEERRVARIDALRTRVGQLSEEAQGYAREVAAAQIAANLAVDLPALADAVGNARTAAGSARNDLAQARAAQAILLRNIESDAQRLDTAVNESRSWQVRRRASAAQHVELAARAATTAAELTLLANEPAKIAEEQALLADKLQLADSDRRTTSDALVNAEAALRVLDQRVAIAAEAQAIAREARATALANAEHAEARRGEIAGESGERFGCPPILLPERHSFESETLGAVTDMAQAFDILLAERERIGPVNLRAETELAELEATQSGSTTESAELETAIARLRGSIGALNREGRVRLLEAFEQVDGHFRTLFSTLFEGGAAHLELTESDDPLEAGLEILAQPPGKKLQSLTLLSGGEQALTAVALIFALFLTNPAPICVLDEVDAPLDDANVERFCDLLDRMVTMTTTRFLIVTHNAVTMSRMHRLYGVTMAEPGVSQLVSVDLQRAELLLAAQ